jgi:Tol biopolymer transport system component
VALLLGDTSYWSPDGLALAFIAEKEAVGRAEVFVARPEGGGEPVKVSGTMVAGGGAITDLLQWSPDGTRLAFVAEKDAIGVREMYVAPASGQTAPVKVSGTLVAGGNVDQTFATLTFGWSPDATRIAFIADKEVDERNEVYLAAAAGGSEPAKASGILALGGDMDSFFWSPDGTQLLMKGDKDANDVHELYVSPAEGGEEPTKISGALTPGGEVAGISNLHFSHQWSPDGLQIAYRADKITDNQQELFVTLPGSSGEPQRASGALDADRDVGHFLWSRMSN